MLLLIYRLLGSLFMQFSKILKILQRKHDNEKLLVEMFVRMLLPDRQKHELRNFHLAELVLEHKPIVEKKSEKYDTSLLIKNYDNEYAPYFISQENFTCIPYLSWINWQENTYLAFSGTFAHAELYFRDQISKGCSLDSLLLREYGFSYTQMLDFFLPRIHHYVIESGLQKFESEKIEGVAQAQISPAQFEKCISSFYKYFRISKNGLSPEHSAILNFVSKKPGQYSSNLKRVFEGTAEIMQFPVVELKDCFLLAFPQQVMPAVFLRLSNDSALKTQLRDILTQYMGHRVYRVLTKKFLNEPAEVIVNPSTHGKQLADIAVLFDRKILLFTLYREGHASMSKSILSSANFCKQLLIHDSFEMLGANGRTIQIDAKQLEFFHFAVVDTYTEMELQLDEPKLVQDENFDSLTCLGLETVLEQTIDALEFIKFFRMRQRGQSISKAFMELGGPVFDSLAIFKQQDWLKPTNGDEFGVLFIDSQCFDSYLYNQILEFRTKHQIVETDGLPKCMSRHYPNCLQVENEDGIRAVFPSNHINIRLSAFWELPPTSEQIYKTWHVSVDSLCYHIGANLDWLVETLKKFYPNCLEVAINVSMNADQPDNVQTAVIIKEKTLLIQVYLSLALSEIFLSGDNQGERLIFGRFLEALGINQLDELLPKSKERHFQLVKQFLPHKSWNELVKAIPIYESDFELIAAEEWKVLKPLNISPGIFTAKKDIFNLLGKVLQFLRAELKCRIQQFNREGVICFAYQQLEAAYIETEFRKKDLIIQSQTAEYFNAEEAYIKTNHKGVQTTFATRLILESALQLEWAEGMEMTLEGYSELLALADRIIEIDFLGDMILVWNRADQPIPSVELTSRGTIRIIEDQNRSSDPLTQYIFRVQQFDADQADGKSAIGNIDGRRLKEVFEQPIKSAFGVSLSERVTLNSLVLSLFDDREVPLLTISPEELLEYLLKKSNLSVETIKSFLSYVTLSKDMLQSSGEIQPSEQYWRSARVLNRPLILLDDSTYLFSHSVVHLAQQVFIERLASCRIDTPSDNAELKHAFEIWSNEMGEEFKQKVIELLSKVGWKTNSEVKAFNGKSMPKEGVGPIDIIAINYSLQQILLIECKKNYFVRSPKDLLNELAYFNGKQKDKGEFQKFTEKIQWSNEHLSDLAVQYGIANINNWSVKSIFISTELIFCASLVSLDFMVMTIEQFVIWFAKLEAVATENHITAHSISNASAVVSS